ncbi:MAG: DUF5320 family protein [Candidatus Acetothermia bacterium]|jgi:predicted Fe-Mo cluster-binding NifX family protein|nr:DUF5320 family protein [Candidatus Acetothermia bacterium]MDH7505088.1 NifB/NifX family molybdenum-iron cluster-binding protein [Candidatus Acetothermia bacterium]
MKIVVATTKGGLDDQVAPTFGRTPTFTVVEVEGGKIGKAEVVPNQFAGAPGGAGIQAAQWAANAGAKAVIAGNYGPNASGVLGQAGIELLTVSGLTVREAVERYLKGELAPFSVGAMATPGCGMGRGMGRGGGMGMGRGMWGQGMMPPPQAPIPPAGGTPPMSKEQELRMLRDQAEMLEQQLKQIKKRLEELGGE